MSKTFSFLRRAYFAYSLLYYFSIIHLLVYSVFSIYSPYR